MPDEGVGEVKIGQGRALRRQPFERVGDALENVGLPPRPFGGFRLWLWTSTWTSTWPLGVLSEIALLLAGRRWPSKPGVAKTAKNGRF